MSTFAYLGQKTGQKEHKVFLKKVWNSVFGYPEITPKRPRPHVSLHEATRPLVIGVGKKPRVSSALEKKPSPTAG